MAGGQDNGKKTESDGKEELLEHKKTLEKGLLKVEQRLTQQADEVSGKGESKKNEKENKKKAACLASPRLLEPHESTSPNVCLLAGFGFSKRLS